MRVFLLCLVFFAASSLGSKKIEKQVLKYFDSQISTQHLLQKISAENAELVAIEDRNVPAVSYKGQFSIIKWFYSEWKKFRRPIEHSLEQVLKETYGEEGMNVYVRRWADPLKLSDGVFVSDNIVNVLFIDLYLTHLPHLTNPEVSLALASNVLRVEAKVNRMFVQADYQLFRNLSDVAYSTTKLDPYKMSPFNLQQVKNRGEVTIIAEDCTLTGLMIATLHAQSVNLGHDSFKLSDCKFSVEISTPGLGSPPVISPYFSQEQGMELELILVKPIRDELVPKLQGAVFTFVNTSSMFGDNLPMMRYKQHELFKDTASFMTHVIRNVNQATMAENLGLEKWGDIIIKWSDKNDGEIKDYQVDFRDMTVSGLDSAYSAQNGGPYKMPTMKIDDTVRFSALQIRGTLIFSVGSAQSKYVFYGEVQDVAASVSIGVDIRKHLSSKNDEERLKPHKSVNEFGVSGWRYLDLHAPNLPLISPHSLITGVLLNELPHLVIKRLSKVFAHAIEQADKKIDEPDGNKKNAGNDNERDDYTDGNNKQDAGTDNQNDYKNVEEGEKDEPDDKKHQSNERPTFDETSPHDPMIKTPMFSNPMFSEPMMVKPMFDRPMFDKPMFDKPMFDTPFVENSLPDKPYGSTFDESEKGDPYPDKQMISVNTYDKPNKAAHDEPMVDGPSVDEHSVEEPPVEEPMSDKTIGNEPKFNKPMLNEPMFGKAMFEKNMFDGDQSETDVKDEGDNHAKDIFSGKDGKPMPYKPISNEPMDDQSTDDKNISGEPISGKEAESERDNYTEEHVSGEGGEPADNEPTGDETMVNEPVPNKPMVNGPMFNKPMFDQHMFDGIINGKGVESERYNDQIEEHVAEKGDSINQDENDNISEDGREDEPDETEDDKPIVKRRRKGRKYNRITARRNNMKQQDRSVHTSDNEIHSE